MRINGNGAFDPGEVAVMQEAFDIAWRFLQRDPVLGEIDANQVRDQLARELLGAADTGETDVRAMADRAILAIRRTMRQEVTAIKSAAASPAAPTPAPA